jgi:hypothetical protein
MLVKTYLHPTAVKYLEETVDESHTNPYSGAVNPQYYVTLTNGTKYLLDVYEPNNELVAVYSMESVDEGLLDSMADELDTMGEYVELCAKIERHLLKLAKLHKIMQTEYKKLDASLGCESQLSPDRLLEFINKLNNDYVKNFLK